MADVILPGPVKEWLIASEVQQELGLTEGQFMELVRLRLFPPGIRAAHKAPARWRNADVAAYMHLLGRGCLLQASALKKSERAEKDEEEEIL